MSSQLKISADTSEVKKSILDLSRSLKNIGSSKVAIFSTDDKKFLKTELKKEMNLMKQRLKENRDEIKKMVQEQKEMVEGSKEELEVRRKILESYKTQSRLSREFGEVQSAAKANNGGGGMMDMLTGKVGGILGSAMKMIGGGALALAGAGIYKGIQGTNQYVGGAANRVRLKGLGVNEDNFGSPQQLANAGLTEQEMIQRRINATAVLGRQGTNNDIEMQKAKFERAYGLQGGTMTGIAGNLRGNFGGAGANEAQMKLQASVFASGIEDAIGPYLETMSNLLNSINENGTTNTADVTKLMAQMTKDSGRTPEQLSKTFSSINNAMMGASGESSAFLQAAFAQAGIGGGKIGGTKFALQAGGLFGLDKEALAKRGYNPELLKGMEAEGQFSGVGARSEAVMNLMRKSGGLKPGQSISDVTNPNQMYAINEFANKTFGTKGNQGFESALMLEKVQNGKMSPTKFDEELKKLKEGKDPQVERLDKVNSTLAGQTDILTNIDTNLAEALGKEGVVVRNAAKNVENTMTSGEVSAAQALNQTGVVQNVGKKANSLADMTFGGGIGGMAYDAYDATKNKIKKWIGMGGDEERPDTGDQSKAEQNMSYPSAKDIGDAVATAIRKTPIQTDVNTSVNVKTGFGNKTTGRTYK